MRTDIGRARTPDLHRSWLGAWLTAAILSGLGLLAWRWNVAQFPPQDLFGVITRFLGVPKVFQLLHAVFGLGQGAKIFAFAGVALLWLGGLTLLGRLRPLTGALGLLLILLFFTHWTDAALYAGAFWLLRTGIELALRPIQAGNENRRALVAALGGGSALLVGGGLLSLFRSVSLAPSEAASGETLLSGVTPVENFYYVSKNLEAFDPRLNGPDWRLTVDGMVQRPASFGLADLGQFEGRTLELTLSCISNPVGGGLISNGLWTGFPVADLLRHVGVQPGAKFIIWKAADGYVESLPLGQAFEQDVLLVYGLNGAPLTARHGFPLRVIIPGRYGMKQPRWITGISLSDHDEAGYWVTRGWSKTARVELTSRIDTPSQADSDVKAGQPTFIRGIAFGGLLPITRVEVSTDGGATWQAARLEAPRSKHAWTLWSLPWTPREGDHELAVRAFSGSVAQKADDREALPEGATGYHRFTVRAS